LLASDGKKGALALPSTVTSLAEPLVEDSDLEVRRTPASLAELTRAAATDNVVFALRKAGHAGRRLAEITMAGLAATRHSGRQGNTSHRG
jgi:hypothetical protein